MPLPISSRSQCMLRSTIALSLWVGACLCVPSPAPGQVAAVPPQPVSVQRVYTLPFSCIDQGLGAGRDRRRVPDLPAGAPEYVPGAACGPSAGAHPSGKYILVQPGNADVVATVLQPTLAASAANATVSAAAAAAGTATASVTGAGLIPPNQFVLTATDDKNSLVVFCRAGRCNLSALEEAIRRLARPKYAYYEDYPIDSEPIGKALAKVIPIINAKLTGEVINTSTIRVESSSPLTDAEVAVFKARLAKDQAAIVDGVQPGSSADKLTKYDKTVQKDLGVQSPDVEVSSVDLPVFCQANDLKTPPSRFDSLSEADQKKGCPKGGRKVQATNVDAVYTAVSAALAKGTSKLTLSKDGNRILIACDAKCAPDALEIVQNTIAATARISPQFAMDQMVPRGTSKIAARLLNAPPLIAWPTTDTTVRITSETPVADDLLSARLERVREEGFGKQEAPAIQRMFYRSAADVVGDLLSTPPPGTPPSLGGDAATAPVTGNSPAAAAASPSSTTTPGTPSGATPSGTTISIVNNPAPTTPTPAAPPAPGPPPSGNVGQGMTSVGDNVVFTDTTSPETVRQKVRLLTLLDFPRPEVLMNMWSFQASSPDGKEIATSLDKLRNLVSASNDALQHAIDDGWGYLSRRMKDPGFFEPVFTNYLTRRFVADTAECEAQDPHATGCLTSRQRDLWGLCPSGQYCLGYEGAFQPVRPTLTSILLGMMAAKDANRAVLTTIGCMEGKFEVYGSECFPDRNDIQSKMGPGQSGDQEKKDCLVKERAKFLNKNDFDIDKSGKVNDLKEPSKLETMSCELLDRAAIAAQKACNMTVTLPLSCFTLEAASSFLPDNSFSTFQLSRLNNLAEEHLADMVEPLPPQEQTYSAPRIGLLRSAVTDFLFYYKMASQYPNEFGAYSLPHSAQELNALFNPLVVAFNQDVGALSRALLEEAQRELPGLKSHFRAFDRNRSYIANGMITVRGISGVESLVDTDTQNSFDATQAQTLNAVLGSIMGTSAAASTSGTQNTNTNTITVNPDGSAAPAPATPTSTGNPLNCSSQTTATPLCAAAALFRGASPALGIATALAAITPTKTHSIIGRQLTLDVIPHTLPGASSAELDVRLWAQEDSAPTVYSEAGTSGNDYQSRVARHNVATRVRVESVKLFDVSTFAAMVQRPRAKLPIVPPLIEIPLIGSILSIPLPAAKIYHASSAIVSAIIVPTAADLAYGLVFEADRAVFREDKNFSRLPFSLRKLTSQSQLPETAPIYAYHGAMVKCLATNGYLAFTGTDKGLSCGQLSFADLPPDR